MATKQKTDAQLANDVRRAIDEVCTAISAATVAGLQNAASQKGSETTTGNLSAPSISTHTPGPWSVTEQPKWPFEITVGPASGPVVSMGRYAYSSSDKSLGDVMMGAAFPSHERQTVVDANARQVANARLIAAAPDMLAALSAFILAWEILPTGNYRPHRIECWLREDMKPAIDRARAVFAKATHS